MARDGGEGLLDNYMKELKTIESFTLGAGATQKMIPAIYDIFSDTSSNLRRRISAGKITLEQEYEAMRNHAFQSSLSFAEKLSAQKDSYIRRQYSRNSISSFAGTALDKRTEARNAIFASILLRS